MKTNIIKKIVRALLLLSILVIPMIRSDSVEAASSIDPSADFLALQASDYTWENKANHEAPTVNGESSAVKTAGVKPSDWVFAGWFKNLECTQYVTNIDKVTDTTYAKFVPAGVLSTKLQVTNGVVEETSVDNAKYVGKYVLRFITSVDTLRYEKVGFELSYQAVDPETGQTRKRTGKVTSNTVLERIDSTIGYTSSGPDTYNFSPKVMDVCSEYFFTAKLGVAEDELNTEYTVRAFWLTADGTTVYGESRCFTPNDGLISGRLNLSIDGTLDKNGSYMASYKNYAGTTCTANVEVLSSEDGHSNVRLTGFKDTLSSVTEIKILDKSTSTEVGSTIYRNFYTKYKVVGPDTTWYTVYKEEQSSTKEFVIATDADLYGIAKVIEDEKENFNGKIIYVMSDIVANERIVSGGTGYTQWTPIGNSSRNFLGTFDGQNHTISGIYVSNGSDQTGLFGMATNATIRNFRLKNSYFQSANNTDGIGSIVASVSGASTIERVYSEAIIECTSSNAGGFVGEVAGSSGNHLVMKDCWFAGEIVNKGTAGYRGTGGLVGGVNGGKILTMSNCMNSGIVDASSHTGTTLPYVGGLVGHIYGAGTANINNSLHMGTIMYPAKATGGYASMVGYIDVSGTNGVNIGKVNITQSRAADSRLVRSTADGGGLPEAVMNIPMYSKDEQAVFSHDGKTISIMLGSNLVGNSSNITNGLGNHWKSVVFTERNSMPVLTCFEDEVIDTSWYTKNQNATRFYINDRADLYGLVQLAWTNDFAGKTIYLTDDIEVNVGDALKWKTAAPGFRWAPIGYIIDKNHMRFAGTFDGQLHSITGLYFNTTNRNQGLFAATDQTSIIKNLKLTNSYFRTYRSGDDGLEGGDIGSIVGSAMGTLDTVYSNAFIDCGYARSGGLVAHTSGDNVVMKKCWFDGTITNIGNVLEYETKEEEVNGELTNVVTKITKDSRGTGGLVGWVAGGKLTIENCLNTGTVDASAYQQVYPANKILSYVGGLVGLCADYSSEVVSTDETSTSGSVFINNSVNTGIVSYNTDYIDPEGQTITRGGFGSIIGFAKIPVNVSKCYATETCEQFGDQNPDMLTLTDTNKWNGDAQETTMTNLDWMNVWQVKDGLPVLRAFMEQ